MDTIVLTSPEDLCQWLQLDAPAFESIPAESVPEPYRHLLVHENDMTGRLEAYYNQAIHLETLKRVQSGAHLFRQVLLRTADERVVEYGVIRIHLERFQGEPLRRVLGCLQPLGGILNMFGFDYHSDLGGFVRIHPDHVIGQALALNSASRHLYGRQNRLVTGGGDTIADVLEILPPTPER